ncbi:MAG: SCO family protein [Candidatus Nitrospinota bacterium M3_3B_026]
MLKRALVLAVVLIVSPLSATAPAAPGASVLERSELAVGRKVRNYRLITQDGDYLPFHSLKGRPVLVSFMYVDCHGPCWLINESLKNMLAAIDPAVAGKLMTLSISIDNHNDNPARLREYGAAFADNFERWIFTTTDDETLGMMVSDLGFSYEKKADSLDHLNRLTLVAPDGSVARHFYGVDYDPAEVENAVRDVLAGRTAQGRMTSALSKLLIYCSNYDPVTKTYKVDYTFVFAVILQYILIVATVVYLLRGRIAHLFSRHSGRARGAQAS